MNNLNQYFLLDPHIHFLNHGSFGATPKPVFEAYQDWQRRLERQPVLFLGREHDALLKESRTALGAYLNADADDLVYIPNATHGVNIIARSLNLQPGDEILTGQIPVDLQALGADVVFGNTHKWMMSPKGAAFLFVRKEIQPLLEPLVVSWGYGNAPQFGSGSRFVDLFQWTGTKDPAAALAVPEAIKFGADHHWEAVRQECHQLLVEAVQQVCQLVGLGPLYPLEPRFCAQMAIAPLPASADLLALKARLYDEYQVEVPLIQWQDRKFVRISIQGYNEVADVEALLAGLSHLLPQVTA